ncbi:MAG: carboxypeptidase-like regulatory domain-containing protein, partial [Chloroflexi bacterium]
RDRDPELRLDGPDDAAQRDSDRRQHRQADRRRHGVGRERQRRHRCRRRLRDQRPGTRHLHGDRLRIRVREPGRLGHADGRQHHDAELRTGAESGHDHRDRDRRGYRRADRRRHRLLQRRIDDHRWQRRLHAGQRGGGQLQRDGRRDWVHQPEPHGDGGSRRDRDPELRLDGPDDAAQRDSDRRQHRQADRRRHGVGRERQRRHRWVTLTAGNTTTQNFALAPNPGTITGTVTDAGTGAPIAGATVSYSGGSTTTDGSGAYTLANVAEGSYSVTAGATGYTSQSRTVTVGPGGTATQNFALTRPNGAITGTVTSAATGSPISGATVSYSGGSTTTNGSGQYTLLNVAPGTYSVTASATGYSSKSQSVAVGSGQTATANFALRLTPLFSDGFESGTLSSWTASAGLTVQTATVHSGTYAAEGSTITGQTYAVKQLSSTYSNLYYLTYVNVKSQTTGFTLMADQTASGGGIIRIYLSPQHELVLWNDITQLTTTGPAISLGAWHSIELHVIVNATFSTTEVWLDGALVPAFSSTMATLGILPVGQVQLGSQAALQIYDVAFDDVAVSTSRIGQ